MCGSLKQSILTDKQLQEKWVFGERVAELVFYFFALNFDNLNDFLFQFVEQESSEPEDEFLEYAYDYFNKSDNIIYFHDIPNSCLYNLNNLYYKIFIVEGIMFYIENEDSFMGKAIFYKIASYWLNDMWIQEVLIKRLKTSKIFYEKNQILVIETFINFFPLGQSLFMMYGI